MNRGRELKVGIDVVQISRVAESLEKFGTEFQRRLFTPGEIAYATSAPALAAERFAARFAAKEAAIKALSLANVGIAWTQLEVERAESGECELRLHGQALAAASTAGLTEISLSLSHDGDYATAIVVAFAPALIYT
jgi:holo-[acyl-carrier protein] synthase